MFLDLIELPLVTASAFYQLLIDQANQVDKVFFSEYILLYPIEDKSFQPILPNSNTNAAITTLLIMGITFIV